MINRILVAEDHESANISLQKTLEDIGINQIDYVFYCDDAMLKIRTALQLQKPYDLLITDLHFEEDGQVQQIKGGLELIAEARRLQPELKVLVFSAESKPAVLEQLFNTHQIDGYIRKARNDAKELQIAMEQMAMNRRYLPRHVAQNMHQKNAYEFTEYDITILSLLANGVPQKNIPDHLIAKKIRPAGLSSIEKRLNQIKSALNFSKNEQLVAFCKDMGVI